MIPPFCYVLNFASLQKGGKRSSGTLAAGHTIAIIYGGFHISVDSAVLLYIEFCKAAKRRKTVKRNACGGVASSVIPPFCYVLNFTSLQKGGKWSSGTLAAGHTIAIIYGGFHISVDSAVIIFNPSAKQTP